MARMEMNCNMDKIENGARNQLAVDNRESNINDFILYKRPRQMTGPR